MVNEKLSAHEVEREVVQSPANEQETTQHIIFDDFRCR